MKGWKLMKGFLVLVGAVVLVVFGVWGIGHAVANRDGPCGSVGPRPKELSGRIRQVSSHQLSYIFYYPGVYEWSGKRCRYLRRVGRVEYELVMGIAEGD